MAYLKTPSFKDPKAEGHTAEIISLAPNAEDAKWKEQPWHKRDAAYKALKEKAAQLLIAYVNKRVPGIAGAMMGGIATCAHIVKPWHLPMLMKLV